MVRRSHFTKPFVLAKLFQPTGTVAATFALAHLVAIAVGHIGQGIGECHPPAGALQARVTVGTACLSAVSYCNYNCLQIIIFTA